MIFLDDERLTEISNKALDTGKEIVSFGLSDESKTVYINLAIIEQYFSRKSYSPPKILYAIYGQKDLHICHVITANQIATGERKKAREIVGGVLVSFSITTMYKIDILHIITN